MHGPIATEIAASRNGVRRAAPTQGAAIAAVGSSVPPTVVTNAPIAARLGVTDEWITRRTGTRSRHIAAPGDRLDALAAAAGQDALDRAGVAATDVDLLLMATMTADEVVPNAGPLVAHALGATNAGAIDIGAACSGFLSALALGAGQVEMRRADTVLVIGADLMSRVTDPDDRSTAAVFADGAGAVLLTATDGPSRIGPVSLGCDGELGELIVVSREDPFVRMQGQETFRHAVARMSAVTIDAVDRAELEIDDIDLFVYHQANTRILQAVGDQLGLREERVVDCVGIYANTTAGTLPLALAHAEAHGRLQDGDRVLLATFGAGLTWGATVVTWGVSPQ